MSFCRKSFLRVKFCNTKKSHTKGCGHSYQDVAQQIWAIFLTFKEKNLKCMKGERGEKEKLKGNSSLEDFITNQLFSRRH